MKLENFRNLKTLAAAILMSGIVAACGDVAGIEENTGEVQITLQEAAAEALFSVVAADFAASPDGSAARVSREVVRSLTITVTGIQLLPYCEDAGENNGDGQCEDLWVTLELDEDFTLDLLNLPTEDDDAVTLAAGTVPVGEYHKIRLFISEAWVTFFEEINVGQSTFLPFDAADDYDESDPSTETVYPVEIPSAQNTGIKADIYIEVLEGDEGDVALLFDADATFRDVIATGSGRIKMPPVLKARQMNQHQNQNQDPNQNQNQNKNQNKNKKGG